MPVEYIKDLEKKVSILVKEAHKRKKNAKKTKVKHYFDGQSDAFEQILMELKNLKYELDSHIDDNDEDETTEAEEEKVKKDRRKTKVKATEEQYPEEAVLLEESKERGVIVQKSSHYFHEAFVGGKVPGRVQGKLNVLKELAKEDIAQKIREQLAQ
jgi:hypothetical protein